MRTKLKWKKWKSRADKSLVATDSKGQEFLVLKDGSSWVLERDREEVCRDTKMECMERAEELSKEPLSILLSKKQIVRVERVFREAAMDRGVSPTVAMQYLDYAERLKKCKDKITPDLLRRFNRKYHDVRWKRWGEIAQKGIDGWRKMRKVEIGKKLKGPQCHCEWLPKQVPGASEEYIRGTCPVCKPVEKEEVPPKQLPSRPVPEGYNRVLCPAGKCPYKLENAKWKTLEEWVEGARDWYEDRHGKFLTLGGLMSWINLGYGKNGEDRTKKAMRRIALLCQEEWQHECDRAKAEWILATTKPRVTEDNGSGSITIVYTGGKHASGRNKTKKKPGVISRIVEILKKASKKKPTTREAILEDLVETFPDRDRKAMRNTIGSQIPAGLRIEKGLKVHQNSKGYWLD